MNSVNEIFDNCEPVPIAGCWLWQRSSTSDGYGKVQFNGRMWRVHRVVWMLANGPIPEGLCVLHHCDTPGCCNGVARITYGRSLATGAGRGLMLDGGSKG